MPKPWTNDVTTNRIYNCKVALFEKMIEDGERRDQNRLVLDNALLDLVNHAIITDEKGRFTTMHDVAEVVLPMVEEALDLTPFDTMHNRLSVEQNYILALRQLSQMLPDKHIHVPLRMITRHADRSYAERRVA